MQARLYLVKSGVAYDVAFCLEDSELMAYCIIMGQLDGGKWNWNTMQWLDPNA